MSRSFCRGATRTNIAAAFLAILLLLPSQPRTARADIAGQQAAGSANYPNGGLNYVGNLDISKDLLPTDAAGDIALNLTAGSFFRAAFITTAGTCSTGITDFVFGAAALPQPETNPIASINETAKRIRGFLKLIRHRPA